MPIWSLQKHNFINCNLHLKDQYCVYQMQRPVHSSSVRNSLILRRNTLCSNFSVYSENLDAWWIFRRMESIKVGEISAHRKLCRAKFSPLGNFQTAKFPRRENSATQDFLRSSKHENASFIFYSYTIFQLQCLCLCNSNMKL